MCITLGCCKGSHTFVCFEHRAVAKGPYSGPSSWRPVSDPKLTNKRAHPRCPRCRRPMVDLGLRARVPPKRSDRGWRVTEAWAIRQGRASQR